MSFRRTVAIATLTLASLVPAVASAGSQHSACILGGHQVTSVTPYKVDVRIGRGSSSSEVRGAVVHVLAERGLTAEWLRLELGRHLAAMQKGSMPDCALDLKDVRVQVDSSGSGFDVKVIAKDRKQAQEVLRRARLLAT